MFSALEIFRRPRKPSDNHKRSLKGKKRVEFPASGNIHL